MMHTYQIANSILQNYKNEKLSDERVNFLISQASEQLEEIAQNEELYNRFLEKANANAEIDSTILWMLIMSNETLCEEYIEECNKKFREIIPVSDLADLLVYFIYLKKIKNVETDGFELLLSQKTEGIDEFDQYAFTNVLLYVQKSKEVEMEF